jgi:hypothetical protein
MVAGFAFVQLDFLDYENQKGKTIRLVCRVSSQVRSTIKQSNKLLITSTRDLDLDLDLFCSYKKLIHALHWDITS